jgi:hypothetical protein
MEARKRNKKRKYSIGKGKVRMERGRELKGREKQE